MHTSAMIPVKSKPIPPATHLYPVTFERSTMDQAYEITKAEESFNYATSFVKPILFVIGTWPLPSNSLLFPKIVQSVVQCVACFLFAFMVIPNFLYIVYKANSSKLKMKLLGPLIMYNMQVLKYLIMLFRMKEIRQCLNMVKQDWYTATKENRLILLEKAKEGKKIVLIVAITIYGGGTCYRLLPMIKGPITLPDNTTIKPFPLVSYYVIFNPQQSPIYEIICAIQFICGFTMYTATTGTIGITVLLGLHVCALLKIMDTKMKQLSEKENMPEWEVQRRIADIVDYQWNIKRFLNNVQKISELICLVEVVGGTTLMGLGVYYFLVNLANRDTASLIIMCTLTICCSFCVFVLCYIGQLLLNESQIVSQTSCTMDWYRLPVKHARSLILIIVMSNYPMRLTAGKMIDLSLATFTDICKLSMGYLNILRETM